MLPAFDSERPWGAYLPKGVNRLLLGFCHGLTGRIKPFYRLVIFFRRPIKYRHVEPLDVTIWGLRMRLLPRGNLSEAKLLFSPQFFDPKELRWLTERMRAGATFVDVGANAGAYSFHMLSRFGRDIRIVAVEPDPEMRRRLAFNMATNGVDNMEVCPVALSDRQGRATLMLKEGQRGQNALAGGSAEILPGRRELEVEVDTLLDLLRSRGVTRIDALKMDIEGHEPVVLGHFFEHAPRELLPAAVIVEVKADTAPAIAELFQKNGYRRVGVTGLNWMFERVAA